MGASSPSTRWKGAATIAVSSLFAASIAYQRPVTLELDMGRGFPTALALEGFHDTESGYRWTRARSRLVFPDVGAGRARLDLQLSGFRPPGGETPLVLVKVEGDGGESSRLRPARRVEEYPFETRVDGLWSSDLEIEIRSETFSPGAGDKRALGVRLHRARLSLDGWRAPPLRQLTLAVLIALLAFALTPCFVRALGTGLLVAFGLAFFRLETTLLLPWVAAIGVVVVLTRRLAPAPASVVAELLIGSVRAFGKGLRASVAWPVAALAVGTLVGVPASYWLAPEVTIDMGSGAAAPLTERFGPLDREVDVSFERTFAGAKLDLQDFGGGSPWRVAIWASVRTDRTDGSARGVLVRAGGSELVVSVTPEWRRFETGLAAPPLGFRSGHRLEFPGLGAGTVLRIDRVVVDRGRSMPPVRVLLTVFAAALAMLAAFRTASLSLGPASIGAGAFLGAILAGLVVAPVLVTPLLGTLLLGAASAWAMAATTGGVFSVSREHGFSKELAPGGTALALAGFVVAFAALSSPLYSGGHFAYHTAIAEEIWHGRFLLYYFPGPDNMLSHQPQWGNLTVPHSCLYHTLASPFAALPRSWFLHTTKLFIAALLYGIALSAALVATDAGGKRPGIYAAGIASFLPTGFQLLGLGHLMTLFGTWASAVALGFITLFSDRLRERAVRFGALALLTLCFLSYTGSLLFASTTLAAAVALLWRAHHDLAKRLILLLGLGWLASFLLYYVHWTVPFVTETLPALVSGWSAAGDGGGFDLGARVAGEPSKLAYTFGTALFPLFGLVGLAFARPPEKRTLVLSWGGVLILFSGLDIFFNFLLKHHYFTYPVLAVGASLALDRLSQKNRLGRAVGVVFLVYLLWMGCRMAVAVATGVGA